MNLLFARLQLCPEIDREAVKTLLLPLLGCRHAEPLGWTAAAAPRDLAEIFNLNKNNRVNGRRRSYRFLRVFTKGGSICKLFGISTSLHVTEGYWVNIKPCET